MKETLMISREDFEKKLIKEHGDIIRLNWGPTATLYYKDVDEIGEPTGYIAAWSCGRAIFGEEK